MQRFGLLVCVCMIHADNNVRFYNEDFQQVSFWWSFEVAKRYSKHQLVLTRQNAVGWPIKPVNYTNYTVRKLCTNTVIRTWIRTPTACSAHAFHILFFFHDTNNAVRSYSFVCVINTNALCVSNNKNQSWIELCACFCYQYRLLCVYCIVYMMLCLSSIRRVCLFRLWYKYQYHHETRSMWVNTERSVFMCVHDRSVWHRLSVWNYIVYTKSVVTFHSRACNVFPLPSSSLRSLCQTSRSTQSSLQLCMLELFYVFPVVPTAKVVTVFCWSAQMCLRNWFRQVAFIIAQFQFAHFCPHIMPFVHDLNAPSHTQFTNATTTRQ